MAEVKKRRARKKKEKEEEGSTEIQLKNEGKKGKRKRKERERKKKTKTDPSKEKKKKAKKEVDDEEEDEGFDFYDVWEDKPAEIHDQVESLSFTVQIAIDEESRFHEHLPSESDSDAETLQGSLHPKKLKASKEVHNSDEEEEDQKAKLARIQAEEKASEVLLHETSHQCPDCKVMISKIGTFLEDNETEACHHMICQNHLESGEICGAEFCWLCGGLYYGGDPTKRVRLRKCDDEQHNVILQRDHGGTILHCHHNLGCPRLE